MWLVLFYSLVLHARLLLGHWPEYNAPDPKDMGVGVGIHMAAIYFGIPIALVAPALALILTFAFRARLERRTCWLVIGIAIISPAVIYYFGQNDPGDFFGWFID